MKKSFIYIILVIVFIILITCLTVSNLFIKYKENGKLEAINNYYDVLFTNVIIDKNDNSSVKIDNANKSLHIQIPSLEKELTIMVDLLNIGNVNAKIKNYSFSNIISDDEDNNIITSINLKEGDIIKGSEYKKLIIKINNKDSKNIYQYNFNLNFIFEEVNL